MRAFFDTNILVYAAVQRDPRHVVARRLLVGGGSISVQVVNEFANVARRKLVMSWDDIRSSIRSFSSVLHVPPMTLAVNDDALTLADTHKFAFYDALIIASALEARCSTLYTEDMHHGMMVRQSLQIVNPFVRIASGES